MLVRLASCEVKVGRLSAQSPLCPMRHRQAIDPFLPLAVRGERASASTSLQSMPWRAQGCPQRIPQTISFLYTYLRVCYCQKILDNFRPVVVQQTQGPSVAENKRQRSVIIWGMGVVIMHHNTHLLRPADWIGDFLGHKAGTVVPAITLIV